MELISSQRSVDTREAAAALSQRSLSDANETHATVKQQDIVQPAPGLAPKAHPGPPTGALTRPGSYVLGTGIRGQARLEISERIYGPHTRRLFQDLRARYFAGGQPIDMAVVGCGSGAQVPALCDFVGAQGSLWLTDVDQEQVDLARERVNQENRSTSVTYAACDVHTLAAPRQFDVIYARFLLVHLDDPTGALTKMAACLRPGGVLVCDEHDVSNIRSLPATAAPEKFRALLHRIAEHRGLDYTLAARLGSVFAAAGLPASDACLWGATLLARDQDRKSLTALSLVEGRDKYVADGLMSEREIDRLIAEMWAVTENSGVVISVGSQWQMWAKMPEAGDAPRAGTKI